MRRRIGAKVVPGARLDGGLFGRNLGEDWVVPRDPIGFLVASEVDEGALLTAYTEDGRVVGERFADSLSAFGRLFDEAHQRGLLDRPAEIPPEADVK